MPRPRPPCTVCQRQPSKYACASCRTDYCSVPCYKRHKETCTPTTTSVSPAPPPPPPVPDPDVLQDPVPLRPLTSLTWPYVPDTSVYPDPLTRDDPKPLQHHQYEAIATSSAVRTLLRSNPRLCDLLTSIDALRGADREEALQRALGIDTRLLKNDGAGTPLDEDTTAFRALAEAVEAAVRGGKEDALGLDWD